MAGYRDKWQTGFFRSVEFKWQKADTTVGRKTARHDYPLRDDTYIEDMGKRPREFTLDCFVIGADYIEKRDALIEALEAEGPGTLQHPTMGMMLVNVVGEPRLSESTQEGGMCRFSITFVLAPEKETWPSAEVDTAATVDAAADEANIAIEEDFTDQMTVDDQPAFVADDAKSMTDTICDNLNALSASFPTLNMSTPGWVKDLNKIKTAALTLIGKPMQLAQSVISQIKKLKDLALAPLNFINSLKMQGRGLWSELTAIVNLPMSLFNTYAKLFSYGLTTSAITPTSSTLTPSPSTASVPATTPARIQQAKNRDAINALVRRAAVIEAARTSSIIEYTSSNEAVRIQAILVDAIDAEMLTAPDAVFTALVALRSAVIKDITTRGADLSRLVTYTPIRTEPALLIAHRLYGDATREQEIVARNKIRHPLFVSGGVALEVHSD